LKKKVNSQRITIVGNSHGKVERRVPVRRLFQQGRGIPVDQDLDDLLRNANARLLIHVYMQGQLLLTVLRLDSDRFGAPLDQVLEWVDARPKCIGHGVVEGDPSLFAIVSNQELRVFTEPLLHDGADHGKRLILLEGIPQRLNRILVGI
jgi:hypothetical protein